MDIDKSLKIQFKKCKPTRETTSKSFKISLKDLSIKLSLTTLRLFNPSLKNTLTSSRLLTSTRTATPNALLTLASKKPTGLWTGLAFLLHAIATTSTPLLKSMLNWLYKNLTRSSSTRLYLQFLNSSRRDNSKFLRLTELTESSKLASSAMPERKSKERLSNLFPKLKTALTTAANTTVPNTIYTSPALENAVRLMTILNNKVLSTKLLKQTESDLTFTKFIKRNF